jgi:cyclase
MVKRGVIVAKMAPGCEGKVAAVFAASDATELPRTMQVRHRSLYVLEDVYIHLVEMGENFDKVVAGHRDHPLFKQISKDLEPYIQPYNPATWKSPKDATAREFYSWDNPEAKPGPCRRGVIVAKMKAGCETKVAAVFAASDATDLPRQMQVRHRSLFMLEDVYVHLVEMGENFDNVVAGHRDHPLFKQISTDLEPYIQPYNPATWKSPKDATAREFYRWDTPELHA